MKTPKALKLVITSALLCAMPTACVIEEEEEPGPTDNGTTTNDDTSATPENTTDASDDATTADDDSTTGTMDTGSTDESTGCTPTSVPVEDSFDDPDLDPERWYTEVGNGTMEVTDGSVHLLRGDDVKSASHLLLEPGSTAERYVFPTDAFSISMDFACPEYGWCSTGLQFNDRMTGDSVLIRAETSVDPAYTSFHIDNFAWGGMSPSINNVALTWESPATLEVSYDPGTGMIDATLIDSEGVMHMLSSEAATPPAQHTVALQIAGDAPDPGTPVGRIDSVSSTFLMEVPCD